MADAVADRQLTELRIHKTTLHYRGKETLAVTLPALLVAGLKAKAGDPVELILDLTQVDRFVFRLMGNASRRKPARLAAPA